MGSAELSKIGDMSTVLRLPHMDIVLDDQEDNDNDEDDDQGDKQRQEPEHRQLNRMKMQRQKIDPDPPAQPPEDVDVEKEKSLVEILLRKYGFGRWTLPPDDSSTETAEGSAFSRTALEP